MQLAWAIFDPRGTGFVRFDDLRALLLKLPAPWGLHAGSSFREYLHAVDRLELMAWHGYVHYHDVLLALHRVHHGVGMPTRILKSIKTASSRVHERITADLQVKLHKVAAKAAVNSAVNSYVRAAQRAISSPWRRRSVAPSGGLVGCFLRSSCTMSLFYC
jgi:hypothetical protein